MSGIGQIQRRSSRNETGVGHSMYCILVAIFLIMCTFVNIASCKSASFNGTTNDEPWDEDDDASLDWQLSTDNVDFYKMLHLFDIEELITLLKNASQSEDMGFAVQAPAAAAIVRRHKRSAGSSMIFGDDGRKKVATFDQMPYAASVRISTGCSGTLIGPKHVLTAAHCSFKGRARKTRTKLKVGFISASGRTRWRKVRAVHVTRQWHTTSKHRSRMIYDYAVLELRREHKRPYMTPVAYSKSRGSKVLQFNGFPVDKQSGTMWHTSCAIIRDWYGYLINHCDIAKGMSGSGSYLTGKNNNYEVRGLAIAAVTIKNRSRVYRFNVVNPLTQDKRNKICKMMRAGKDCKSFK